METINKPDNTAVRTALWRALHVQTDAAPHIIEDTTGLRLIAPEEGWQQRPDMHAEFTKRLRASMVARARFIEDLIIVQSRQGIGQYVILGAGLDTFAQRQPDIAFKLQIYEIDQPGTQTWKQQRLKELGFGIPENLHFVSVDFEKASWWDELLKAGFDLHKPAVVACTGVTLYLTREAISAALKQMATLAPGSVLVMTFYLPLRLMDKEDQPLQEIAEKGAREAGTPFLSFFAPEEVLTLAKEAGFKEAKIITTKDLEALYFANRPDGLLPASGELFLVAAT
ncbi:methyltransferase [Niabella ginsenosidivorans]|uniref:S-adenosyl-L-methionine-dependent methyltransferase n=1 Tax=Niabella ginsenosidivorans TaxID=1176587 RepID=A0A1A9I333_9BACT|nr:class I SAM-dependent methyltransferase [Niabella ginsenosidivorans]ANH81092.1 methyltransferase [Niabella ginsenosidivorans]